MPGFNFGEKDSFATNWKAFLTAMDTVDPEMASILRRNEAKLAAIVQEGSRDAQARADFNSEIIKALDRLLAEKASGGN
jgi:erythromycin esterase-like protein